MEAKALVNTLHGKLPEAEAERHWDILVNIKAEALANPLTVTLVERRAKTPNETNSNKSGIWRPRQWSIR